MVAGVHQDPLDLTVLNPGRNPCPGCGEVGGSFQPFNGEHIGFAKGTKGFPGPLFRGGVHKTADQQMVPLVWGPQQLQAGHGGSLADRVAYGEKGFGCWKVIGLVGEGKTKPVEPLLDGFKTVPRPANAYGPKQLGEGDSIFHGHGAASVQHHGQSGGGQHESHKGNQGRSS